MGWSENSLHPENAGNRQIVQKEIIPESNIHRAYVPIHQQKAPDSTEKSGQKKMRRKIIIIGIIRRN